MFSIDVFNNLEPLSIYLTKPSGEIIYCLDDYIIEEDTKLTIGLNQQFILEFSVRSDYANGDKTCDLLQEGMYLFVEKIGLFKMKQPMIENDGITEFKSVTAHSCDVELEDKNCCLSLNMGTPESQEYLVTYEEGETESLVNPYTNIPYDWLVIYNTFPEQLSIVANKYSSGYYGSKNARGEILVSNKSLVQELTDLFNLIPRLKNKIIESTDANGVKNYSLTEYVLFTYDAAGEKITAVTLLPNFLTRVQALITFYTKYRKQLSLLSVVLDETNGSWTVGDIYGVSEGDYSLANRKYQFTSDQTIYSFLTYDLAGASQCIVSFDILNRKVNMTPVDKIGNDTGIVLSYENLVNTLNISCNDDTFTTRLYVNGGNDLNIRQVNFGLDYIDDITYKLNARDSDGNRIYVSDALAEKYMKFIEYRESQRADYIRYSKDYRYYNEQINELKYRVPNDSLKTDWGTFSYAELEAALTTYKNLLAALITIYKEDYGSAGVNADGSVNESYIKNTMYWYDYKTYKDTITEIECACHTYPYYSDMSKWSAADLAQYKDAIKAWETEWSLYGTIELQAKIDTYTSDMKILSEQSVILVSGGSDKIKTWAQLTVDEKKLFGNLETNYYYDTYMKYYNYRESAKEYLAVLQSKIAAYEDAKNASQNNRQTIVKNVTLSNYFTESECKEINLLYRDSSYTNENILTTVIDNSSKSIDIMNELLEDGKEKLSTLCRPQLTFSVNSDNLLGLADYKPFWKEFLPGNYILVQYKDNVYVKLRMVGFQFNPSLPSCKDFAITFSNHIRSKTMVSDLESLLGMVASSGTNNTGGSGSGASGNYGESDDIDVTISNTMLAKLLNCEMFGTRVTNIILDTIDANSITAKYAKFEGLAKGTTLIDGKCITTGYIVDQNYNGNNGDISNIKGSVINLETGNFNFAGGKLKFDGTTLAVKGVITADSGYIGGETGFTIASGRLFSNGHSYYNSAGEGVYIGTDYISLGNGGVTYFKNDGTGKIGSWYINANAIYRVSPVYGTEGAMYFGTDGLSISNAFRVDSVGNLKITDKFIVTKDGVLTATSAKITGDITANELIATTKGKIACWNINNSSIYYGQPEWGKAGGLYFGVNGLSLSNKFTVTAAGNVNIGDKLKFDGTTLSLSSDVTLSWNQINGADDKVKKAINDAIDNIPDNSGDAFVSSKVLYYVSSSSEKPSAPTSEITTESTSILNAWSTGCFTRNVSMSPSVYEARYYYWTCIQNKKKDGTLSCTAVTEYVNPDYVTKLTKDTITTSYINALDITARWVAAENIIGTTIAGKNISGGTISIGSNFSVDSDGVVNVAGFILTNKSNINEHAYANTLYRIVHGSDGYDYQAGIKAASATNGENEAAFYVRKKLSTEPSWSNSTIPFYVRNTGHMYCENINIGNSLYAMEGDKSFKILKASGNSALFGIMDGGDIYNNGHFISVGETIDFWFNGVIPLSIWKESSKLYYIHPTSDQVSVDLGSTYGAFRNLRITKIIFADGTSMTTAPKSTDGTTTDYNALNNKPSINGTVLSGSLSLSTLGIAKKSHTHDYLPATLSGNKYKLNANTLQMPNMKGYNVSDYNGSIVTGIYMDDYGTDVVANNRFIVGAVNHPTVIRGTELRVWDSDLGKNSDDTYNYMTLADYIKKYASSSGGSGTAYSAGSGISISGTTISVDTTWMGNRYAAYSHSHSGYASSTHDHGDTYAYSGHSHSEYAASDYKPRGINNSDGYGLWINTKTMIYGATSKTGTTSNGIISLGGDKYRFKDIYLTTSPSVTSDRNAKENIKPFDKRHEESYMKFKPCTYMLKNLSGETNHDRVHYGIIAQEVENTLMQYNISNIEAGFFCKSIDEESGQLVYGLRYEELVSLNMHMIQKAHKEIEQLNQQNNQLITTLLQLQGELSLMKQKMEEMGYA